MKRDKNIYIVRNSYYIMTFQITKMSSKGQMVIPFEIRQQANLHEGETFSISTKDNLIVLKKINKELEKEDLKTFIEIKNAWQEIEQGKCKKMSGDEFLKEIEKW